MRSLKTGQGSVASCRRVGRLAAACLAAAVLAAAATAAGQEQKTLRQHPGYFPVEDLDLLEREALSIEINLHGAMLRLVAAATRKAEPEFSNLIADPEAVRVRIAPLAKLDLDQVRSGLARASKWLEERGWETIIRTREADEELYIYLRQSDDEILGMALMGVDPAGEVAIINIIGQIELSQLERLGEVLHIPHLSPSGMPAQAPQPSDEKGSDR